MCVRVYIYIYIYIFFLGGSGWTQYWPKTWSAPDILAQALPDHLSSPVDAFRVGSGVQVGFTRFMVLCSALVVILKMMIVLCFLRIQAFHKLPKHRNWDLTRLDFERMIASHKPQTKFQKIKTFVKYIPHYVYTITSIVPFTTKLNNQNQLLTVCVSLALKKNKI